MQLKIKKTKNLHNINNRIKYLMFHIFRKIQEICNNHVIKQE